MQPTNLKALTEGIHSKEALEMVREHLLGVMGPATQLQFSNAIIKMSKFQMAQVSGGAANSEFQRPEPVVLKMRCSRTSSMKRIH